MLFTSIQTKYDSAFYTLQLQNGQQLKSLLCFFSEFSKNKNRLIQHIGRSHTN